MSWEKSESMANILPIKHTIILYKKYDNIFEEKEFISEIVKMKINRFKENWNIESGSQKKIWLEYVYDTFFRFG